MNKDNKFLVLMFGIALAGQAVFSVFFVNQTIFVENQIKNKNNEITQSQAQQDKYRLNKDVELNNTIDSLENNKTWEHYTNIRTPLKDFKDKDPNNSPKMEI